MVRVLRYENLGFKLFNPLFVTKNVLLWSNETFLRPLWGASYFFLPSLYPYYLTLLIILKNRMAGILNFIFLDRPGFI
jgi:hypothetical protein